MSKKCTGCKTDVSEEWTLSRELAKSNRRMFIIIIVVVSLWVASLAGTIAGFLWYLNQYDFVSEEYSYTQDGQGTNIIGDNNEVDNGAKANNP